MLAVRLGAGVRARPAAVLVVACADGPAGAVFGCVGVAVHAEDGCLHPLCFDAADGVESTLQRQARGVSYDRPGRPFQGQWLAK
jgi:hypothetical protein